MLEGEGIAWKEGNGFRGDIPELSCTYIKNGHYAQRLDCLIT